MKRRTLAAHVKRFLDVKYNPQTRAWYAKYLKPMVEFVGAERTVESVTRDDAEAYWHSIRSRNRCWDSHPLRPNEQRPLSPTTLHNHLRAVRAFWNEMTRQRLVEFNPFDHLKAPKDTRPVEMKAISPEGLQAIWKAAKASSRRDYAIVTVMATTGLRAGELISMALDRLDLSKGVAWVHGKRGWRKIFLGETSVKAIRAYLRERQPDPENALWLNVNGYPFTADGVRQMVDRLARRARVTGRHNLHSFRHRAAQAWLDRGVNVEIVAVALGHADVNVTLSIYGNQDDERVKKTVQEFELSPFDELP